MWTNDPVRDAERYFAEQERKAETRRHKAVCECCICGEELYYGQKVMAVDDEVFCMSCVEAHTHEIEEGWDK